MLCINCGAKTLETTTTDVTELENCLVIVKNTPCHKCTECCEVMYKGDVVRKLEEVAESVKTLMNEVSILDYGKIVA